MSQPIRTRASGLHVWLYDLLRSPQEVCNLPEFSADRRAKRASSCCEGDDVRRLIWARLIGRGSRTFALFLGLLIACAGFTVLTAQTRASTLQVQGKVSSNARSAYDILVRPQHAAQPSETRDGLVQAGFLSGIHGGIGLAQWHRIQEIAGVQVAAPVAVVGYVVPKIEVPVDISRTVRRTKGPMLVRVSSTWHTDNGASVEHSRPRFLYITPRPLKVSARGLKVITTELGPDRKRTVVCRDTAGTAPWTVGSGPTGSECVNRSDYLAQRKRGRGNSFTDPVFAFPFLVEAVDPSSEAQLVGLNDAIVSGGYLPKAAPEESTSGGDTADRVPVIVASRPATHVSVSYRFERLSQASADGFGRGNGAASPRDSGGEVIASGSMDQNEAYRRLLSAMATRTSRGDYFARQLSYLYTPGPTSYETEDQAPATLRARTVENDRQAWANPDSSDAIGTLIPAGGDDTSFRTLTGYQHNNSNHGAPPIFVRQGVFDAAKLPGYSALAQVPLGTYATTTLMGATATDKKILGNQPLQPSPNIAGYPQPAPLMLTTLDALAAFDDSSQWTRLPGGQGSGATPTPVSRSAPISSIRVRVKDVRGVDDASRQRVRLVANQISEATGLRVDITVGSSPTQRTVTLAAGRHGRPPLTLIEYWVKKGTALQILSAIDKKSVALFLLVLLVSGLFVANASAASVRARRSELGMLACLGWHKFRLFALVAGELMLVALAAGLGGGIVALVAGAILDIEVSPARAALAIPAAVAVATAAGAIPAWQAAHAAPLEAVRPTTQPSRRAAQPSTVTGLAWTNLARNKARSFLAAAGVAVAVTALTEILGIVTAFRGAVVGTLLGSAVTVQVRGADVASVAAIMLLAGVGVANVLFLNIRDRGSELATLRSLGWRDQTLARLLVTEGVILGLIGALVGAIIGSAALTALVGELHRTAVVGALYSLGAGAIVTAVATLPPMLSLRRLNTTLLLSEE